VLVHFIKFWCIWDHLVDLQNSMQNGPNWCKSSWYEVASQFFATNAPNAPPLDPELMFWCVLYKFGAFVTVWLSYETRCKTGGTGAKVFAKKSLQNFSQRTHPIHPIGPYHVSVRFVQFWCIWDCLVDLRNSVQNGPNWCKSSCHEVASEFFATNAPNPPHWTLNSCFCAVCIKFWCICDRLVELRDSVQNGPNWCKSL